MHEGKASCSFLGKSCHEVLAFSRGIKLDTSFVFFVGCFDAVY